MKILLGLRVILLIILFTIVFLVTNETITFAYWYSDVFILFTCFLALITCFKYDAIKYIFEKVKKHKFIFATIVVIAFFTLVNLIYYFVLQFCEIDDWYSHISSHSENEVEVLLSFAFLPEWYSDINVFNMTLLETIFSLIFIIIAQAREKLEQKANQYATATKYGVIGYILDRLVKNIFKYKLLIIFFIFLLTISSKFLIVYYAKIAGVSILALAAICFIIKNYLSIKKCIDKNSQKYGKEILAIVVSQDSKYFSFVGDFVNPLYKFYKYNTSSIGKSLIVDAKDYVFVSYDAIRYNLINSNEYKIKAYAIFLKPKYYSMYIEEISIDMYQKGIDEMIGDYDKYIIFPKFKHMLGLDADKLSGKFIFRYKNNFDINALIAVLNLTEDDINLKEEVLDELVYIYQKEINANLERLKENVNTKSVEDLKNTLMSKINNLDEEKIKENKNIYIKYGLNTILKSFNYIEYFYSLLKICEYIIHYMGLKNVINNPQEILDRKIRVKEGGLASWRDSIDYDKSYNNNLDEDAEIIDTVIKLRNLLDLKTNYSDTYKFEFKKDLCSTVIDIRNNLLGHGVVTYDVSERIVKYLFIITKEFIKIFESIDVTIEEDEKIKKIFGEDIMAIYKENKFVYLYSKMNKSKPKDFPEYLNYETGKRIADGNISEKMDKIWTPAEIEETLGKFM